MSKMTELEKKDIETLIEICKDWGFEYSLKNTSKEVEEVLEKLEKMLE